MNEQKEQFKMIQNHLNNSLEYKGKADLKELKELEKKLKELRKTFGDIVIFPTDLIFVGKRLTNAEFKFWTVIKLFAWELIDEDGKRFRRPCFPGRKLLAGIMDISERQVSKLIKGLEEKGLLKVDRKRNKYGKNNTYKLFDPPKSMVNKKVENNIKKIRSG